MGKTAETVSLDVVLKGSAGGFLRGRTIREIRDEVGRHADDRGDRSSPEMPGKGLVPVIAVTHNQRL